MVFRAGVIGCGMIGSEASDDPKRSKTASHAGAYFYNPKTKLVAVCDVSPEKLEKARKHWNIPLESAYSDYKEMLAKEKLDIVSVCTREDFHWPVVEEAVKHRPKVIFCEKPVSNSLKDGRKLVEACRKAGIMLVIDHQRRLDAFHRNVDAVIKSGGIGKIQQATFYYGAGISNTGTHMLDLLLMYLGDAEWVQGNYSTSPSNNKDTNIDGMIKFKRGATATVQACDSKCYAIFELALLGTAGRINITMSGFDGEFFEVADHPLFSGYKALKAREFPFDKNTPREYMAQAVAHILDCLENGKQPSSTGEDGLKAFELICALHQSAKNNGMKVSLPLATEDYVL